MVRKKNLEKNFETSDGARIYDFNIYKLEHMIDHLCRVDIEHPDIYVLFQVLDMYLSGEVVVKWVEGYPMVEIGI